MTQNDSEHESDASREETIPSSHDPSTEGQSASNRDPLPSVPPTPLTCVKCGYNLWGFGWDSNCPECGTPVRLSPPAAAPFLHRPAVDFEIDEAAHCVRCGGSIGGQRAHGTCPSCGVPIWYSIYGNWLRASDPAWLRKVRGGVTLWIVVILGGGVGGWLGMLIAFVYGFRSGGGLTPANMQAVQAPMMLFSALIGLGFQILLVRAALMITAREPGVSPPGSRAVLRTTILGCLAVTIVSNICMLLLLSGGELPQDSLLMGIAGLVGTVVIVGLFLYLRDYARRIPSRSLTTQATWIMWGYGAFILVFQAWGVAQMRLFSQQGLAATAGTPSMNQILLSCFMAVLGLLSFALMVWLVVFLFQLRGAFGRAIQQVEADTALVV